MAALATAAQRSRELPLALVAAAFATAYWLAPTSNGTVTCLLRLHVGQACPGCGASRATGRLVHGDLGGAWAYHPWMVLAAVQVVGFAVWRVWWGRRPLDAGISLRLAWLAAANVGLLFVVWGVRIATGHLDNVY